jgi:hypothetical protein
MPGRRHCHDEEFHFASQPPSSSDPKLLRNSGSISPALTVIDSSSQNLPSYAKSAPAPQESGLDPLSSVNYSYKQLVPETLTSCNDRHLRTMGNQLKAMGESGWNALETALSAVNGASGIFPPLKAAVEGLLGVMKQIDVRAFTAK